MIIASFSPTNINEAIKQVLEMAQLAGEPVGLFFNEGEFITVKPGSTPDEIKKNWEALAIQSSAVDKLPGLLVTQNNGERLHEVAARGLALAQKTHRRVMLRLLPDHPYGKCKHRCIYEWYCLEAVLHVLDR